LTLERVLAFGILTWTLGIVLAIFDQADQLSRSSVIGVLLLLGLFAFVAALVLFRPRVRPAAEHILVEAAISDSLTGLPNERYLLLRLEEEMTRARRDERPLALAVIDINGLAVINEQHGRDSGDEVLRHVARVAESTKRASDIVARLGDDEFAVILSECTNEGGQAFVHRLTERLAREPAAAVIDGRTSHIWVGVCAGLADLWPEQESPADFLDRARNALVDAREEREHRRQLWRTA
jgi:diguanylate cyclase (GGDEF)-like protein